MSKITIHPGDNRISLASMSENSVDSVVCDPPYGLVSVAKRFGKEGSAPARVEKNDGSFNRLSSGFMGKAWDGSGIEVDPEFWALVLRVLKPGGYIVAFSASRTYHRMAVAIEDAGFITHPLIGWAYGQGFPKAHAADKAIDKMLGKEGSYDGVKPGYEGHFGKDNLRSLRESGTMSQDGGFSRPWMSDPEAILKKQSNYQPATPEAAEWQGWAYGGQVRKPALEPIYVGQKPFSEKSGAANILKWGVGAVNVDGCRVAVDPVADASQLRTMQRGEREADGWGMGSTENAPVVSPTGRHPANLILSPDQSEYEMRRDISKEQRKEVMRWFYENS